MTKVEHMEQRLGNTVPGAKKSRRWVVTINNWIEKEYILTMDLFPDYIIGKEKGNSGTEHLQIYGEFKNPQSLGVFKKTIPRAHCEFARGSRDENLMYCSKEKDFVTNFIMPRPLKIITELYPWQKRIEDLVKSDPDDDRSIYWFWEGTGNIGKTALIKYLVVNYKYVTFSRATKSADILTTASSDKRCYLFDFSRSQEGFTPWNALEQLKDGMITDSKLKKESRLIIMNSPIVICFANWPPVRNNMSADKWKITELGF